jgi:hypothetical protein
MIQNRTNLVNWILLKYINQRKTNGKGMASGSLSNLGDSYNNFNYFEFWRI